MGESNFHVITGASGAGKSSLLKALGDRGYSIVPEVALALVQEQEQSGGDLFPWTRREDFMRELFARNMQAYEASRSLPAPVFFDRALPECVGHMALLGMKVDGEVSEVPRLRRYAQTVFVAEPWPEIYVNDRWRRAPYERASRSYEATVSAYVDEGYTACILPKASVEERVAFVLARIALF